MKKIIFICCILSLLVCCSKDNSNVKNYGQGGTNASQFAIEKSGIQAENIASVNITLVDSLLTDDIFDEKNLKEKSLASYEKKISEDEFQAVIQEEGNKVRDIYISWKFKEKNDSLKQLDKYQGSFKLVYSIAITTKSTAQQNIRVLMKEDGITPLMTESEFKDMMNTKPFLIKALVPYPKWDW